MLRTTITVLFMTATAALSQDAQENVLGNNSIYHGGVDQSESNTTTNNVTNNTTHEGSISTTTVQNGAAQANGYVTSIPVYASNGTCFGSEGGGLSAAGIGLSSNKTIKDEECNRRMNEAHEANQRRADATLLNNLGLKASAISLMCQDYSVRVAMKQSLDPDTYDQLCKKYER